MHWYVLSETTGVATLCASEQDARREAKAYDNLYPRAAPHFPTQLIPADLVRAVMPCNLSELADEDPEMYRLGEILGMTANARA